ncbi:MAG: outer membrane lipoprotein-sorting protein [Calditrichae bacterium]|nr:outer membrane lipoprotein-sorting protein [Calditrichia bacterium]
MQRSRNVSKVSGLESVSTLTILDSKGRERVRKTAMASKEFDQGRTEKRIIRFLEPADVSGIGMLIFDYENDSDNMWIYMPALRKTRRIVNSDKSKNFMGSEFSNADMTASNIDDFTYHYLGEEEINDQLCFKIEIQPINEDIADENGFSKKISFIDRDSYVLRKSLYYDLDGELLKILVAQKFKIIDEKNGKYLATEMTMENIQNGRKSIMKMENVQFNPNVRDDYFTIRYLEKR